jgi:hypothetical protein
LIPRFFHWNINSRCAAEAAERPFSSNTLIAAGSVAEADEHVSDVRIHSVNLGDPGLAYITTHQRELHDELTDLAPRLQRALYCVRATASSSETPSRVCIISVSANSDGATLGRPLSWQYSAPNSMSWNNRPDTRAN